MSVIISFGTRNPQLSHKQEIKWNGRVVGVVYQFDHHHAGRGAMIFWGYISNGSFACSVLPFRSTSETSPVDLTPVRVCEPKLSKEVRHKCVCIRMYERCVHVKCM